MSVAPVCGRCEKPHFNFVPCDKAEEFDTKRAARVTGPPLSTVLQTVPDGFVRPSGWGKGDGWGSGFNGPRAA